MVLDRLEIETFKKCDPQQDLTQNIPVELNSLRLHLIYTSFLIEMRDKLLVSPYFQTGGILSCSILQTNRNYYY
jgi:hypothetical protein